MKKCLIAALSMAAAFGVQASTITYSGSVTFDIPGSQSVDIHKFDSTLGTLTGVTLSLVSANESANITLNNSGAAADWTVTLTGGTITFGEGGNTTIATVTSSTPESMGADSQLTSNFTSTSGTATSNYGSIANLIGSGYYSGMSVSFAGSWSADGLGSGDNLNVNTFTGNASWQVTYTYTAVPEPTSVGLLALGAMAVGMRRRFKKTA